MPVRQRGETWQADVTWNSKRLRQGGFESRAKAEAWEQKTQDNLKRGIAVDVKQEIVTLQQLFDRTYAQRWSGSKGEDTAVGNAKDIMQILGEKTDPNAITDGDVDYLISVLKQRGLSGATINRKLSPLSTMMRLGKSRGWVDKMPYIPHQKEAEHRLRWLTPEEEAAVLKWCEWFGWTEMHDLVVLLIDTGLRISEALRLTGSDINLGWVRVWISKNGKPRSVPMTDRVANLVKRRQEEAGDRQTIFTMNRFQADRRWSTIREQMQLDKDDQFVIHALRHTCASRLMQAGVDYVSVQQVMGHKDFYTTLRYAHLAPRNLVNAVRALQDGKPLQSQQKLRLVGEESDDPDRAKAQRG